MLSIQLDNAFLAALDALPQQIEDATDAGLDAVAEAIQARKAEYQQETYNRAIPTGKNGKPKWTRSEDWKNDQTIIPEGKSRIVATRGNSEAYEEGLAELNSERRNDAYIRAHEWGEQNAQEVFEQAVRDKLND